LRTAVPETRAQLAGIMNVSEEQIETLRQELLSRLPPESRPGLEAPPAPGRRPAMGLRLGEDVRKRKAE
jgi:hypothetical protein